VSSMHRACVRTPKTLLLFVASSALVLATVSSAVAENTNTGSIPKISPDRVMAAQLVREEAETLTRSMVDLNTAYQKAKPDTRSQALQQLIDATVERQALLAELIKTDPGTVLRTAIPTQIRNRMPAEVQSFIEQRMEIEGELVVMYEDYEDGSYRVRHTLKAESERISLHFKAKPSGILSGNDVSVSGVRVDNAIAVESGDDDILMLACCADSGVSQSLNAAPELTNTLGDQRTLVLLVNFQDDPTSQPWTLTEVADVVFGHTSDFFLENSSGQVWLSGDTRGWYTIPVDSTGCDINVIKEQSNQAAIADGIDLGSYQRIVYFHSENGCGWSGVATLGGEPTTALMNGTIDPRIVGHELGHTLGLHHAHGLECGDDTLGPDCRNVEYADSLDIMGSRIAHFNAFHKERLGWLASEDIFTIETSGSYTLEPYAASPGGEPKTLKILKETDPVTGLHTWYYLEYRQATGFDSTIVTDPAFDSDNILNGVVIRTGTESDGQSSNMLDMTPGSSLIFDWFDSALTVVQSFADPEAGITITTDWTNAAGAGVSVNLAPPAPVCVASNPTLSLSPGESDCDNPDCTASTFDLEAAAPINWTTNFGQATLTLGPGASATTTLAVVSPVAETDGFYTIDVSASNRADGAYTATGSVTYVVSTPVEPPANSPPVALDDSRTLVSKSTINIAVLSNDSDPDGDSLTIISFSNGAKGTVSYNADETLTYTPAKRFKNSDSFSYSISDGVNTANATVWITLEAPADEGGGKGGGKKGGGKKGGG